MTNIIPRAIADLTTQLSTAVGVGGTSFSISSNVDDDGNTLPAGLYCFTIDSGTSNKEYLIGQLNGSDVTSVRRVSRQGVETSGAGKAHRVGAPCVITNFASLQRVVDILRGVLTLDGASPVRYDAEPTLADPKELATVGYVLSVVTGGAVSFDKQTIGGTAGESIVAGNLVYLNESDQEWYKCDADTAATVEGVMRGIALGAGSNGVAIAGGVHLAGAWTTTGLTAGSIYYASNTAGALATSAGTTRHIVGVALSTTRLFVIPQTRETIPTRTRDALSGGGNFGTPSASNKFVTEEKLDNSTIRRVYDFAGSPHTWTKLAGLKRLKVQVWGGGGSGAARYAGTTTNVAKGGSGGGYKEWIFEESQLSASHTVTIGAGGAAVVRSVSGDTNGNNGGNTTFGALITAYGGGGGNTSTSDTSGYINGASSFGIAGGLPDGGNPTTSLNGTMGGGASGQTSSNAGGDSVYGGGGGGTARHDGSGNAGASSGGVSQFGGNGGNGASDGNNASITAASGATPSGGGGGVSVRNSGTGAVLTSGAGGHGRVIVTEYYS